MLTNFLDTGRNGSQCKGWRQTQVAVNTVGFRRQKWAPQILRFLPYTETSSHTVNLNADNSQSTPSPRVLWEQNRAFLSLLKIKVVTGSLKSSVIYL